MNVPSCAHRSKGVGEKGGKGETILKMMCRGYKEKNNRLGIECFWGFFFSFFLETWLYQCSHHRVCSTISFFLINCWSSVVASGCVATVLCKSPLSFSIV